MNFAESEGAQAINWSEVLEKGIAGTLSAEERILYGLKASGWVTCACGNQCELLPRNVDGEPDDEELSALGINFAYEVNEHNYEKAIQTLARIERRSSCLLQDILTK